MIILREKTYTFGKAVKKTVKKIKDNPKVTTATSVASLGLGGLNLGINIRRGRNEKRFQKEQIQATNKLSEIIADLDDKSNKDSEKDKSKEKKRVKKLKNELSRQRKLLKTSQKPYVSEKYLNALDEIVDDYIKK